MPGKRRRTAPGGRGRIGTGCGPGSSGNWRRHDRLLRGPHHLGDKALRAFGAAGAVADPARPNLDVVVDGSHRHSARGKAGGWRLAPSLHGRYPASTLLRTHPSPSRLRSTSRLSRLYDRPCSGDFAPGRGGLLQLLGMSLPPCCRFHPAEVKEPHPETPSSASSQDRQRIRHRERISLVKKPDAGVPHVRVCGARCVVLSRQGRQLLVARHDNAFVNSAPRPNSSGSP